MHYWNIGVIRQCRTIKVLIVYVYAFEHIIIWQGMMIRAIFPNPFVDFLTSFLQRY